MCRKNLRVFKMLAKGFGESFVEMGGVLISSEAKVSNEVKIEIIAKLGMAEDLIADVCRYFDKKKR